MSVINTNQYSALGVQYAFWAALNSGYPYGTTGTIANGAGAGMGRLLSVQDVNVTIPQGETVYVTGDNGVTTSFKTAPQELPSGTITTGVQDQTFSAKANGVKVYAEGDWDMLGDFPACYNFNDMCFVFNSPGSSQESGSKDESSWVVTIILKAQVQAGILAQMQTNAPHAWSNNLTIKRASKMLWGQSLSASNHGSTGFSVFQFNSDAPVCIHTFIGDGSATTVTLNETPYAASSSAVQLWQADTKKTYTTHYTVDASTKVLTFVSAPGAGVVNIIPYKFVASC